MFREEFFGNLRKEIKEERKEWEQMIKQEREKWRKEKENILQRVEKLEWEKEKKDREERRKNIIIKEIKFEERDLKKETENFLTAKLKVDIKIRNAHKGRGRNGNKIVLVKLEERKDKKKIIEKKKELEKGIYIEDDLTWKKREVQKKLRELAFEHRKNGKQEQDTSSYG